MVSQGILGAACRVDCIDGVDIGGVLVSLRLVHEWIWGKEYGWQCWAVSLCVCAGLFMTICPAEEGGFKADGG